MKSFFNTLMEHLHKSQTVSYSCIEELAKLLDEAQVPYTKQALWSGEKIRIEDLCDAACHEFSYGHENNLLEIQGALTKEELAYDSVKGNMTPEEVAKRFIYCYRNSTSLYYEEC